MKKMKSIEGLRRAVNEAEESNIRPDDPLFRHGVPSQVLKHVLRAPWQIENRRDWDKVKNVITFATSFLSDVSGTNVNYIRGADVYTTVRFSDTGEVETVTVKVSDRNDWPEHRGPSYTYTVNDKNRTGEVAHLFQRAEEEVRALLDNDIIDWEGSPRLVRRGRHWGGEGRVGESKARRYVRGQKMFESDNVDLSRYSKQAFVDYMVDHDNYSWSTAEVIFEHIKDTGGSFILSDILITYSEFDSYTNAASVLDIDIDADDIEGLSDEEIEENSKSVVKAEYDVLETEEGNIVVI